MTGGKKILILTMAHSWYENRVYYKVIRSLLKCDVSVFLLTASKSEPVDIEFEPRYTYEVISHTINKLTILKYMIDKGKSFSPDVVICIEPLTLWAGYMLKIKTRCRFVYDCHEFYPEAFAERHPRLSFLYRWFERFFAKRADAIITVNEVLVNYFKTINPQTYLCANYPLRQSVGTPFMVSEAVLLSDTINGVPTIHKTYDTVYVGSLTMERGLKIYLETAKLFKDAGREFSFLIIGDLKSPETANYFWGFISSNGLENVITHKPYMPYEQVLGKIAQAKVGVFFADVSRSPRYHQGINVKIFDYLTQAVPVVINDLSMLAGYIKEAQCGWIVPYDSQQVYHLLSEILSDESVLRQKGENGHQYLLQHNIWEVQEDELYDAVFGELGVRS